MGTILNFILSVMISFYSHANLVEYSVHMNEKLPELYDSITKLRRTSVENDNFIYNFLVDLNQQEFDGAFLRVKAQVLRTVCNQKRETMILKHYKTNLIYRYENTKGQSLGEFMVRPEYCEKR